MPANFTSKRNPAYVGLVDSEGNQLGTQENPLYTVGTTEQGSVTTDSIQDGAVTTPKIADGAVTDAKLANPKVDVPPSLIPQVVIGTSLSESTLGLVGYSQSPMADQLVMYQFGGQVAAADPVANTDAATKAYVDSKTVTMTLQEAQEGNLPTGRLISPQVLRASMPNLSSVAMLDPGATLEDCVNKINEIIQTISP